MSVTRYTVAIKETGICQVITFLNKRMSPPTSNSKAETSPMHPGICPINISKTLVSTSPRGVTLIDVKGVYTDTDKQMLFCALKESETESFQKKILSIDEKAFIVFSESQRIKGNGFYLYK